MIGRLRRVWIRLVHEQRLAAGCAAMLFVTMFLPWYEKDVDALVRGRLVHRHDTLSAFQAFSFVEAAVLLVAAGVLTLLFARGEDKHFHLPGGDGLVVMASGIWVCLLVFIRQLDKPDAGGGDQISATVGVHWGIFVAFLSGIALAYAGYRLRQAHLSEPELPGDPPRTPRQRRAAERTPVSEPTTTPREPRQPRASSGRGTTLGEPPAWEDTLPSPAHEPPARPDSVPRMRRGPLPADPHAAPTEVSPPKRGPRPAARRDPPNNDGGTQLSFDEHE